jgi:hypothetical protein
MSVSINSSPYSPDGYLDRDRIKKVEVTVVQKLNQGTRREMGVIFPEPLSCLPQAGLRYFFLAKKVPE